MAAALFIIFLAAVVLGIPICFSLLISASVSLIAFSDTPMVFIIQKIFTSLDSFSMMAIPFFMIAGGLLIRAAFPNGWWILQTHWSAGCPAVSPS